MSAARDDAGRALKPRDLAERWQCSERHVYNLHARGLLRGFRAGRLLRFSEAEVLEYERGQRQAVSAFDQWKQAREGKARRSA
ncbi:helix-turn-helix domain-containing protein [Alsobacter sp. R-9]